MRIIGPTNIINDQIKGVFISGWLVGFYVAFTFLYVYLRGLNVYLKRVKASEWVVVILSSDELRTFST